MNDRAEFAVRYFSERLSRSDTVSRLHQRAVGRAGSLLERKHKALLIERAVFEGCMMIVFLDGKLSHERFDRCVSPVKHRVRF